MTRPKNHWWETLGNADGAQSTRRDLDNVNRAIDEACKYRDQCGEFAANAQRQIDRLKERQLELIALLKAQEGKRNEPNQRDAD